LHLFQVGDGDVDHLRRTIILGSVDAAK
jgi:hypothetical protein